MNKLTAEAARRDISNMRLYLENGKCGLSLREELYLQALEIALPVLEQQEVMSVPAFYIVYHPNPNPDVNDDKEHSECGSIHLARKLAAKIGGTIRPVYIGEQLQPPTDTYRQIKNDGWIEWGGGECPVSPHTLVDCKRADGDEYSEYPASSVYWHNTGCGDSIIAYRVIENDGREE